MKRLLPMFPLAALLLTTMGVGPCDSKPLGSVEGCAYRGGHYATGASWPAADSACNKCTCTNTGPVCTDLACPDASADVGNDGSCFDDQGTPVVCPTDGGSPDTSVADASGRCYDSNGAIVTCGDAGVLTCVYGGMSYAAGASFPSADGCNTCTCGAAGMAACTTMICASDAATDTAGTCAYQGKMYPVGTGMIPAGDGCNTCTCAPGGAVACTLKACATDAGTTTDGSTDGTTASSCTFDATYVYGWVGGLQAFTDLITLAPPASYAIARTPAPGNTTMGDSGACAPALPMCGTGNGKIIDVPIILADIADPSVQLLLSLTTTQTITLGMRVTADDSLFSFRKNGSAGFLVGSPCLSGAATCTAIPDSVAKLRTDLIALDKQQRMDPACAGALSSGD